MSPTVSTGIQSDTNQYRPYTFYHRHMWYVICEFIWSLVLPGLESFHSLIFSIVSVSCHFCCLFFLKFSKPWLMGIDGESTFTIECSKTSPLVFTPTLTVGLWVCSHLWSMGLLSWWLSKPLRHEYNRSHFVAVVLKLNRTFGSPLGL